MHHSYVITNYRSYEGLIYDYKYMVKFDHVLFEEDLDETKFNMYQLSYKKMTDYLESIPNDSSILYYVLITSPIYKAVLDAFINFCPRKVNSLDHAPQMRLGIEKYHADVNDTSDFGIYEHTYTQVNKNCFFGRTIARSDITFAPLVSVSPGTH